MKNIRKIVLCWELCEAKVPKTYIARMLAVDQDTVRVWVKGVEAYGLE